MGTDDTDPKTRVEVERTVQDEVVSDRIANPTKDTFK